VHLAQGNTRGRQVHKCHLLRSGEKVRCVTIPVMVANSVAEPSIATHHMVDVTGTVESAPLIINQACISTAGNELLECDQVVSFTYVWPVYLPVVLR
jgi:hypothetical protein